MITKHRKLGPFPVVQSLQEKDKFFQECKAVGRPSIFIERSGERYRACLDMSTSVYAITQEGESLIEGLFASYGKTRRDQDLYRSFMSRANLTMSAHLKDLTLKEAQVLCYDLEQVAKWNHTLAKDCTEEERWATRD